ncbi:DNA polymerase III subunit delta [Candidatus Dojkabacteria bacterium]|jgi:DNA polymerase-3 subunit delta|nr:DNA polymerase III subunit delta [Candidatus Dojkabacteria bacterium]
MKKLFHGKDTFLSQRAARKEIENIVSKGKTFEYIIIDATSSLPETIINHLSSDDIFSKPKILLLKRVFQSKHKEDLVKFLLSSFENLPTSNHYIFWEDSKISSITKYFKMFKKDVEEFNEIKKQSFVKWAMGEVTELGLKSDREIISKLSEKVDFDAQTFLNEIEKLVVSGVEEISLNDIEDTVDSHSFDIWKLISAINATDTKKAIEIYKNLTDHQVDSNFILAMLIRNIRLLTEVKYLKEKNTSSSEICSTIGIAPFTLPELINYTKDADWEKIRYFYEKLSSLDYEIKRGTIDIDLGLTLLLTKI